MNKLHYILCLTGLILLFLFTLTPRHVSAQTSFRGVLKVSNACNSTTSISGKNPLPLTVEQLYEVKGLNKEPNPTHAYINIPGIGSRWADLSCGTLGIITAVVLPNQPPTNPKNPPNPPNPPNPTNQSKFKPFFDTINNPVPVGFGGRQDITPPPPVLNNFDQVMNTLCGKPGTVVSPDDFKATLKQFPDVIANIKREADGYIKPGRTSDNQFLDDLTNLWFNAHGFDHVFCGEPTANNIGGLHFVGRYLDLQQKGLAGLLPNSESQAEIVSGATYTLGVVMQVGDRQVQAPIKGYGYTLNAEDILKIATKAYKDNPNPEPTSQACLIEVTDDQKTFETVFVAKNNAIRTFYPDATPDFQKTSPCKE